MVAVVEVKSEPLSESEIYIVQEVLYLTCTGTFPCFFMQDCDPFSMRCMNENCQEQYVYDLSSENKVSCFSFLVNILFYFIPFHFSLLVFSNLPSKVCLNYSAVLTSEHNLLVAYTGGH